MVAQQAKWNEQAFEMLTETADKLMRAGTLFCTHTLYSYTILEIYLPSPPPLSAPQAMPTSIPLLTR
jgi:hypothetical protein